MRQFTKVIFDDVVAGTNPVYSPPQFNAMLGSCEKLAVQIRSLLQTGTPTVTIDIEHSNDGIDWVPRGQNVVNKALTANALELTAYDDSANPRFAYSRFKISCSASASAKVRITVAGRGALWRGR